MSDLVYDGVHQWEITAEDTARNVTLKTCRKCRLLELITLTSRFYLQQMNGRYSRCGWQPRNTETDVAVPMFPLTPDGSPRFPKHPGPKGRPFGGPF